MYLPGDTVHGLAKDARAAGFRYWLMDSESSAMRSLAHGDAVDQINSVRGEGHLGGAKIREAIEAHGWKPVERRLYVEEGPRLAMARIQKIMEGEEQADAVRAGRWQRSLRSSMRMSNVVCDDLWLMNKAMLQDGVR